MSFIAGVIVGAVVALPIGALFVFLIIMSGYIETVDRQ